MSSRDVFDNPQNDEQAGLLELSLHWNARQWIEKPGKEPTQTYVPHDKLAIAFDDFPPEEATTAIAKAKECIQLYCDLNIPLGSLKIVGPASVLNHTLRFWVGVTWRNRSGGYDIDTNNLVIECTGAEPTLALSIWRLVHGLDTDSLRVAILDHSESGGEVNGQSKHEAEAIVTTDEETETVLVVYLSQVSEVYITSRFPERFVGLVTFCKANRQVAQLFVIKCGKDSDRVRTEAFKCSGYFAKVYARLDFPPALELADIEGHFCVGEADLRETVYRIGHENFVRGRGLVPDQQIDILTL